MRMETTIMWQATTLLSALFWVALASCAGAPGAGGAGEASLGGLITAVERTPSATHLSIARPQEEPADARADVRILLVRPGTEVFVQRADGTVARGSAADLAVGSRIRAEHTGVELRSLPPQYIAARVWVLRPS